MGKVVKSIFGGKDSSAQKKQSAQNEITREFIEKLGTQARQGAIDLFSVADENRNLGNQAALSVLGQSAPQALEAFQLGNVGAQAAILGGTPMINMIGRRGGRADLNQFNQLVNTNRLPHTGVNTNFMQQTLPNFTPSQQVVPSPRRELTQLLGGATSDADLLLAASRGQIPGIPNRDQQFFSQFLAEGPHFSQSRQFIDDPGAAKKATLGVAEGLAPENEQRLAHLLTLLQGARNG